MWVFSRSPSENLDQRAGQSCVDPFERDCKNKFHHPHSPHYLYQQSPRASLLAIMSQGRDVSNPIVRTYLTKSTSRGRDKIHARICSREYDLDKRGTGATSAEAVDRARAGVPLPTPRRRP
jgi:hypothetical protein